jgi:DNA polymerase-1
MARADLSRIPVTDNPLLVLVDGHSLAFRSYYAHARGAEGGLRTSTGIPTSVCYGFMKALLDVLQAERPQYVAIAFDLDQPTFRHEKSETYKAGRPETPQDFIEDVENLKDLLGVMGLEAVTAPGYEADDVIGTLATRGKAEGLNVKILSGDQDLFQLIDPEGQVSVLYLSSVFAKGAARGSREFKTEQVKAKLDVLPTQVVDYKALCGDSSDNLPGVKGIGAKTAAKLLNEYGTLDAIYTAIEGIKGATKKKLESGKPDAYHSQEMAQIITDVALGVDLAACKLNGIDPERVTPPLKHLELQQLINRLPKVQAALSGQPLEAAASDAAGATGGDTAQDVAFFTAAETEAAQQLQGAAITPQVITTEVQLYELIDSLSQHTDPQKPVAWDTETTSLEPRDAALVGIGCCWGEAPEALAYIPLGHGGAGQDQQLSLDGSDQSSPHEGQLPLATVLEALRPVLESATYPKALQNAKYDRLVLRAQGINLAGVVFDTMLASYVLNPEGSHNLSDLSLRHLGLVAQSYSDLVPKGKTIADIAIPAAAQYCGTDVHTTYRLVAKLQAQLAPLATLATLFKTIELPLEPVLAEMEHQGIRINAPYLATLSEQLAIDLDRIEAQAYKDAGETFNLSSPKQLSELLFDRLGLDKRKSRRNKSGGYSTDASTLEKLQGDHPVVDLIVEHRTLSKLKSTYVDALPALIRQDTQRVHTDFNQAITATGRLSSSNPNLQNIPIRTAFSRKIRAAFVPEPGWQLVAADYSQIELRILAHLSGEPVLVDAYNQGDDVHALTARLLLDSKEISPEQRRLGKVINFGVIYGMGAHRFAREMGVSHGEAKTFLDRYYDRYPLVFEYLQQIQRRAIAQGYVETLCGRRRYFHFTSGTLKALKDSDPSEIDLSSLKRIGGYDAGLLRAAANAPIQGSSADIIKIAMIRLHELLKSYQARLLLQVHDELVFEVPPEEWKALQPQINQVMESAVELKVPLVVEAHAGPNWMEAK